MSSLVLTFTWVMGGSCRGDRNWGATTIPHLGTRLWSKKDDLRRLELTRNSDRMVAKWNFPISSLDLAVFFEWLSLSGIFGDVRTFGVLGYGKSKRHLYSWSAYAQVRNSCYM